MKHNKKKNIGILFEALTRQVVEGTLNGNEAASQKASKLINKYFKRGKFLYEELSLFNTLLYNQTDSHRVADKILQTTLVYAKGLNPKQLAEAKEALLSEISSTFKIKEFFATKIPNYKIYASIQQLLDDSRSQQPINEIAQKITLEEAVLDHLINNSEYQRINLYKKTFKSLPVDNLTNKILQTNFNQKYDEQFDSSQKQLLSSFINENLDKYQEVANKSVEDIDRVLTEAIDSVNEPILKARLEDAKEVLEEVNFHELDEDNLSSLMTYMDLAKDLQEEIKDAS